MRKAAWGNRLEQLAALKQHTGSASVDARAHSESLHDWLEHQKALLAIGTPQMIFKCTCLAADTLFKHERLDNLLLFICPCCH